MVAHPRRISYVLPSPASPPPLLSLPPLGHDRVGHPGPLLFPRPRDPSRPASPVHPYQTLGSTNPFLPSASIPHSLNEPHAGHEEEAAHPQHCLSVSSLAVDTSTQLQGHAGPQGILYTGGRDGLVAGWELGIKQSRRRAPRYHPLSRTFSGSGNSGRVRWERLTGQEDDEYSDDEDEDRERSSEESGEASYENGSRRVDIPYEEQWEVDREEYSLGHKPPPTAFRQSVQTHTDWVNALLLCNLNQTVVTASSDRTIRAWNPHSATESASPTLIGQHMDYIKVLSMARHPGYLFSGGLDRQILVWDVQQPRPDAPVMTLQFPKAESAAGTNGRGSVYALASNQQGTVVVAGSPERVVRVWDPRSGDQSVSKLVGHTDNVRSVVVSEDGKYLLTGSSDTTVKLWSLAAQRCLHTFTHHTSSVWALASSHPNLERFHSGSRDGLLCAVDLESCGDISDGECVVLAREGGKLDDGGSKTGAEGIRNIVTMDDEFVWTATGSAEVKRWRDVGRRVRRMDQDKDGDADLGASSGKGLGSAFTPVDAPLRNKRLSIDASTGEQTQSLLGNETRESRTVAFAPTASPRDSIRFQEPQSNGSPTSPLNASPQGNYSATLRDRLAAPGQRRTTFSGASIAGSFMSDSSANIDDAPAHGSLMLNGIPYEALVCLGVPESPYSYGYPRPTEGRDPDINTLYSAASAISMPHRPSGIGKGQPPAVENGKASESPEVTFTAPGGHQRTISIAQSIGERDVSPRQAARFEFEDREIAVEAIPLRSAPDEVIAGRKGLIRSLIMNDRQHVLTMDTAGQISVWHIIKGICVGRFSPAEVAAAIDLESIGEQNDGTQNTAEQSISHSKEALELVRERIEGDTMVVTWCSVDTKIGSLTVHLEESRVFDAEVYADEVGLEDAEGIREDSRINLGKWALANLFRGLIKAEAAEVQKHTPVAPTAAVPASPPSAHSPLSTGIHRSPAPTHIAIDRPAASPAHRTRSTTGQSHQGGITIPGATSSKVGLATPAATPAILPDASHLSASAPPTTPGWMSTSAGSKGGLSTIPQSPANTVPPSPSVSEAQGSRDYFSSRGKKTDPSPSRPSNDGDRPATTPGGAPQTPGGGFMGKLKGFGKKKAQPEMAPVQEAKREEPEDEKPSGPQISEEDAQQLRVLDHVRSQAFYPPPPWEAPVLPFPSDTALLISEESKDAGAWAVTYRSLVSSTEADMEPLEMASPLWMLEYLFTSRIRHKEPVKLFFHLEPAPGSGLKHMPENAARLSAARILRVRKVINFVFDKLELGAARGGRRESTSSLARTNVRRSSLAGGPGSPPTRAMSIGGGSVDGDYDERPEDILELVCSDVVLPPLMTLAQLRQNVWQGMGDVVLHYRYKTVDGQ